MITIYTDKNTSRLQYTLNLVFKTVLKIDYQIIHDQSIFLQIETPKISYCKTQLSNELHFYTSPILFSSSIDALEIDIQQNKAFPTFFHHDQKADLSYDIFAMTFYLVSRYEEYTATNFDTHGRFQAKLSLAYQYDFLKMPLVNHLCLKIQQLIQERYPDFLFPKQSFTFLPTYDIDYAWAFQNKNIKRTLGGIVRALLRGDLSELSERFKVQFGLKNDPFYVFQWLDTLHQQYQVSPFYFFLIGDYSTYDKNIHYQNSAFQQLIKQLSERYNIGLHPSYLSNWGINQLKKEKIRLEEISQKTVQHSRQHFLKLSLPETYRNLLEVGIKEDFTMGYASEVGFRASIATPYFWYDLKKEQATDLQITPFQIMDVTLKEYLKLTPEEAPKQIQEILEATKAVNAVFSTLWHNSSFDDKQWKGWKAVYVNLLQQATYNKL